MNWHEASIDLLDDEEPYIVRRSFIFVLRKKTHAFKVALKILHVSQSHPVKPTGPPPPS